MKSPNTKSGKPGLHMAGGKRKMLASKQTVAEMASAGGRARAAKLTPERRKQIAREAANARWKKSKRPATDQQSDAE
jgi:hypothetical protein